MAAHKETILKLIEERDGITPAELASLLGVSTRTLRTHIKQLNALLGITAQIELCRGGGYSLVIHEDDAYAAIRRSLSSGVGVPSTSDERVTAILQDLLMRNGWVKLAEYANRFYVSSVTVSHDLIEVEEVLSRFDLSIKRKPHYGMRVVGKETNRRICLVKTLSDASLKQAEYGSLPNAFEIEDAIVSGLAQTNVQVSSASLANLTAHLAVAVARISQGCYVPIDPEQLESISEGDLFEPATRIAEKIEQSFSLDLPEGEIAYIAIHLAGKRQLPEPMSASDSQIFQEVWDVVTRMLEVVWNVYHIDFSQELELRMNLARHVAPLIVRLRYHMSQENPLLENIKQEFPLAFSMAGDACTVLADAYDTAPSEEEVGFLALAFELALERQKSSRVKKNVLIACATGMGSARMLEHRFMKEFGPYIDTVQVCDIRQLEGMDFSTIDYVFSTIPIPEGFVVPVPSILINGFLDSQDVKVIDDILSTSTQQSILGYFSPALFFVHQDHSSKDEVMAFLADHMVAAGTQKDFLELVKAREGAFTTAFGNQVAVPHAATGTSERTLVAAALLDKPVLWDEFGHEVRVVFLVSFPYEQDPNIDAFFRKFTAFLSSRKDIELLLKEQTWEVFVQMIQRQIT